MTQILSQLLRRLHDRWKLLRTAFFILLAVLVGLNVFIRPHHAEFGFDTTPGFWGIFGLVIGLVMVIIMKKIIQPLIARKEGYYEQ